MVTSLCGALRMSQGAGTQSAASGMFFRAMTRFT